MNKNEFLSKVKRKANLRDYEQAEEVTRAVLTTLREQIGDEAQAAVLGDLPSDIRDLWRMGVSPSPEAERQDQSVNIGTATPRIETGADMPPGPLETEAMPTGSSEEMSPTQAEQRAVPEETRGGRTPRTDEKEVLSAEQNLQGSLGSTSGLEASIYRSDQQLAQNVEDLLDASNELDASDVNVEVRKGRVTLKGSVDSTEEREAAGRLVSRSLSGILVENEIRVRKH